MTCKIFEARHHQKAAHKRSLISFEIMYAGDLDSSRYLEIQCQERFLWGFRDYKPINQKEHSYFLAIIVCYANLSLDN